MPMESNMAIDKPTKQELEDARREFEYIEPRSIFYRAATDLVDLAIQKKTELSLAEAIAVLLQTWNVSYYRFRSSDKTHIITDIENLLKEHPQIINNIRPRAIEDFSDKDVGAVKSIFQEFERVLGKTGAAKCLHLLAPRFFPLWDTKIALAYKLGKGENAECYCRFMEITKDQIMDIGGEKAIGRNPLKALDEYNYLKYTLPILKEQREKRHALRDKKFL
jgi:hypothetical protein